LSSSIVGRAAVAAAIAIFLGTLGAAGYRMFLQFPAPLADEVPLPGVMVYASAQPVPPFALVDGSGMPFVDSDLRGQWTIAAVGYTHCPDFCPTTLADMARFFGRPVVAGRTPDTRFAFISADPFRDTPWRLSSYVRYFSEDFLALTGEPRELDRLFEGLGIPHGYGDPDTGRVVGSLMHPPAGDDYVVDHYSGLLVIDPAARLVASILPPFDTERMDQAYSAIRKLHGEGVK
jgi:protein SCO1/2